MDYSNKNNDEQLDDEQLDDEQLDDEQLDDEQLDDEQLDDEQLDDEQLDDGSDILEDSDLDEETRNIVLNAKLKNIDNFYNITPCKNKSKNKNNNADNLKNNKKILSLYDLKPKRHFNPRLPPWDEYKILKNNKKKSVLDINNKNMFPEL
jgi:hypothetical protein